MNQPECGTCKHARVNEKDENLCNCHRFPPQWSDEESRFHWPLVDAAGPRSGCGEWQPKPRG